MVERGYRIESAHEHETILSQDFVDAIMQGARENLAEHGSLTTTLFLRLGNGERGLIPLSLPPTHAEKRMYFTFLGLSFLETGQRIRESVLLSESWYIEKTEGCDPPEIALSQHPQRKEAITLVGRDALAQRSVFAIQPFHRDLKDAPVFESLTFEGFDEPPDNKYNATGLVDYLFPEVSIDHLH
jgi:hypothetical protein